MELRRQLVSYRGAQFRYAMHTKSHSNHVMVQLVSASSYYLSNYSIQLRGALDATSSCDDLISSVHTVCTSNNSAQFREVIHYKLLNRDLLQVDRLLPLELSRKPVEKSDVEVLSPQQGIAVGRLHLEHASGDLEHGDVERAA